MNTEDRIGFLFKRIHDQVEKLTNRRLRSEGLTFSQHAILTYLIYDARRPVTQKDLVEQTGLSHVTVTGIVNRLVQKDLIDATTDIHDRRCKILVPTEKAKKLAEQVWEHSHAINLRILDGLSEEEIEVLNRLLHKTLDNLKD